MNKNREKEPKKGKKEKYEFLSPVWKEQKKKKPKKEIS